MENKKVAFITLGCKVNQYETNAMCEKFINKDYEIVDKEEKADIYIVNTCTVTNMSDRKSRQMLRRVKEINENAIIVACGCYAQVAKNELEKIDEIDIVLGNNEKRNIVEYVEKYINEKNKIIEIEDVLNILQLSDYEILLNILFNIKTDMSVVLKTINDAFLNGKDLRLLINQMIEFILDLIKGYLLSLEQTEIPSNLYDIIKNEIYNKNEHIEWLKGLLRRLFDLKNHIQYESFNKPFIEAFFINEG